MTSKIMLIAGVSALFIWCLFSKPYYLPPLDRNDDRAGILYGSFPEIVDPEDNITPDRKHKYNKTCIIEG